MRFTLIFLLFYGLAWAETDKALLRKAVQAEASGRNSPLSDEEMAQVRSQIKAAAAQQAFSSLLDLGAKADKSIQALEKRGLTDDDVFDNKVITMVFEANQVRYFDHSLTDPEKQALKRVTEFNDMVKAKLKE